MEYTKIGKITKPFGLKGEMKTECYTDFAEERFAKGSFIYLGEERVKEKVKSFRYHKNALLLLLEGKEDINLIEGYRNKDIYKSAEDIEPLPEGEYYFSDIEGLDVYQGDKRVGKVLRMEEGPLYNFMRILTDEDQKEHLVPFRENFIEEIDLKRKMIRISEMEGLL